MQAERTVDTIDTGYSIPLDYDPVEEIELYLSGLVRTSEDLQEFLAEHFYGTDQEKWLLKETGFEVSKQVEMYLRMRRDNPSMPLREVNELFYTRTKADLLGFYWEFLKGSPILPNPLYINKDDGTVWGRKYGPLIEASSPDERDGIPFSTVKHINDLLVNSDPDNVYMFISPSGWAGNGLEHPESQIYLYRVDSLGDLSALTIRLDMDLKHHEQLLFGRYFNQLSEVERIKNIVSQIGVFNSNTNLTLFGAELLDNIARIKGSKTAWENRKKNGEVIKSYTFEEVKTLLGNHESMQIVDEKVDTVLAELQATIASDTEWLEPNELRELIVTLGKAADRLHILVNPGLKNESIEKRMHEMQQLQGCTGFSSESKTIFINGVLHYYVKRCGSCGAIIESYIPAGYVCSSCHNTFKGC